MTDGMLRSEAEIVGSWESSDQALVTIACATYNHERFIEDALRSFLEQRTSFPFEIVVNDDSSDDGTSEIIRSYRDRYPSIIRHIRHENNLYRQGIRPAAAMFPNCRGKYIAVCEGDDYWIDQEKLLRQVEFMETYSDVAMTYHPALEICESRERAPGVISRRSEGDGFLDASEVLLGFAGFYPTASTMFRRAEVTPHFTKMQDLAIEGDYILAIAALCAGRIGYIDRVMAVYRKHEYGVTALFGRTPTVAAKLELRRKRGERMIAAMESFDCYTQGRYSALFDKAKRRFIATWARSNIAHLPLREALRLNAQYRDQFSWHQRIELWLRAGLVSILPQYRSGSRARR